MSVSAVAGAIAQVLYGTDEVEAEALQLRAGALEMVLRGTNLWQLRVGDVEVWHGVGFHFRDTEWGTPEPSVTVLEVRDRGDHFHVRCEALFATDPPIELRIGIEGSAEGRVRFSAEALPRGDILTNRTGLCVLHPMDLAGAHLELESTDGRRSRSSFPTLIPPWPPFTLIQAIRHEYAPGAWARCVFSGDVFEFEDQRNNSDASFKTYNRSNLMPRPYLLPAGVAVRQSVELSLEAPVVRRAARARVPVAVSVGPESGVLPQIGVEIVAADVVVPASLGGVKGALDALSALRPSLLHLALHAPFTAVDWPGVMTLLAAASAQLRLDLHCHAKPQAAAEIEALGAALAALQLMPESVAVFPSEPALIARVRGAFPQSLVGGGTPHFFTQLNRLERLGEVDFLSFTTSPLVHGASDSEVMLSLQSLPSMLETLRARHGALPVRIGPSQIALRRSPLGAQPASDGTRRIALAARDPRCRGLFGAAWALGYVAQLAAAGADAVTLMPWSGPNGLAELQAKASSAGRIALSPAYFALARLCAPARLWQTSVSEPTLLTALALSRETGRELLLANLSGEAVEVELSGWPAQQEAAILDAPSWHAFEAAGGDWSVLPRCGAAALRLPPYAIASIEQRG